MGDNKAHNFGFNGNDKIARALQLVDENYVDSVNIDSIEGVTVNNLLQGLDPHSLYLPPQQATSINERLDGGFDGIGIEFQLLRDTMVITQVSAGGPAALAGITNGDKVLAVNNKPFTGKNLTLDSVNHVFRGQKGVALALEVKKPLGQIIKHYDIKRAMST